ncbi:MAG: hypothetical protein PHS82_10155 [Lachnospiraceae bacterium]|nr:hypothetical protein [Lachnospiraceae bacterium]
MAESITKDTEEALQNLVQDDILGSIKAILQAGNITRGDGDWAERHRMTEL